MDVVGVLSASSASEAGRLAHALSRGAEDADAESRRIEGEGTPEVTWREWGGLERLVSINLSQIAPRRGQIVVVAPHPDDEVLGCGGLLAMLSQAGRSVHVIGVTDGEASYAGSRRWPPSLLATTRRRERVKGLRKLGPAISAVSLEVPDGQVADFEDEIASMLENVLRPEDIVLTTWRFDGHPDHEATARAAANAAIVAGCRCWETPVWMWHWATPDDARVPWGSLRRLELTAAARQVKALAIAAHASQLEPIPREQRAPVLPDWALARLLRPFETFFEETTRL